MLSSCLVTCFSVTCFLNVNVYTQHERRRILDNLTPGDISILMQAEDEVSETINIPRSTIFNL